jgi:hypothetical protein
VSTNQIDTNEGGKKMLALAHAVGVDAGWCVKKRARGHTGGRF